MSPTNQSIIYTLILIATVILTMFVIKKAVRKFSFVQTIEIHRRKVVSYLSYIIVYLVASALLAAIWGGGFKQILVAFSSVLTILGIGFFAQWSMLSNITASAILFFNHPIRIGDRITIIDIEYDYTGIITNISGFFLFMKTDDGKNVTIPTSLIMQKGIEITPKEKSVKK